MKHWKTQEDMGGGFQYDQKEHEKLTVKYDEELAKRRKKYRQAMKK